MYIAKKERENKKGEQVYYFYLAVSKRVEGKVTNIQKYMISLKYDDLLDEEVIEKKIDKIYQKFEDKEIEILRTKLIELSQ